MSSFASSSSSRRAKRQRTGGNDHRPERKALARWAQNTLQPVAPQGRAFATTPAEAAARRAERAADPSLDLTRIDGVDERAWFPDIAMPDPRAAFSFPSDSAALWTFDLAGVDAGLDVATTLRFVEFEADSDSDDEDQEEQDDGDRLQFIPRAALPLLYLTQPQVVYRATVCTTGALAECYDWHSNDDDDHDEGAAALAPEQASPLGRWPERVLVLHAADLADPGRSRLVGLVRPTAACLTLSGVHPRDDKNNDCLVRVDALCEGNEPARAELEELLVFYDGVATMCPALQVLAPPRSGAACPWRRFAFVAQTAPELSPSAARRNPPVHFAAARPFEFPEARALAFAFATFEDAGTLRSMLASAPRLETLSIVGCDFESAPARGPDTARQCERLAAAILAPGSSGSFPTEPNATLRALDLLHGLNFAAHDPNDASVLACHLRLPADPLLQALARGAQSGGHFAALRFLRVRFPGYLPARPRGASGKASGEASGEASGVTVTAQGLARHVAAFVDCVAVLVGGPAPQHRPLHTVVVCACSDDEPLCAALRAGLARVAEHVVLSSQDPADMCLDDK